VDFPHPEKGRGITCKGKTTKGGTIGGRGRMGARGSEGTLLVWPAGIGGGTHKTGAPPIPAMRKDLAQKTEKRKNLSCFRHQERRETAPMNLKTEKERSNSTKPNWLPTCKKEKASRGKVRNRPADQTKNPRNKGTATRINKGRRKRRVNTIIMAIRR